MSVRCKECGAIAGHGSGFDNLWARGYYCGSAGHVSQEQVKRYIQEQMGKDVFEYDIYVCPNTTSILCPSVFKQKVS